MLFYDLFGIFSNNQFLQQCLEIAAQWKLNLYSKIEGISQEHL